MAGLVGAASGIEVLVVVAGLVVLVVESGTAAFLKAGVGALPAELRLVPLLVNPGLASLPAEAGLDALSAATGVVVLPVVAFLGVTAGAGLLRTESGFLAAGVGLLADDLGSLVATEGVLEGCAQSGAFPLEVLVVSIRGRPFSFARLPGRTEPLARKAALCPPG